MISFSFADGNCKNHGRAHIFIIIIFFAARLSNRRCRYIAGCVPMLSSAQLNVFANLFGNLSLCSYNSSIRSYMGIRVGFVPSRRENVPAILCMFPCQHFVSVRSRISHRHFFCPVWWFTFLRLFHFIRSLFYFISPWSESEPCWMLNAL